MDPERDAVGTRLTDGSLDDALQKLRDLNVVSDVTLFDSRTYEVPLKDVGVYIRMRLRMGSDCRYREFAGICDWTAE